MKRSRHGYFCGGKNKRSRDETLSDDDKENCEDSSLQTLSSNTCLNDDDDDDSSCIIEEDCKNNTPQNSTRLIENLFKHVKSSGNIFTSGEASNLPNLPGLYIKNFGNISVPLNELQAKELIKVCKQAPYGKNYDTIIDKNVRDTYELEPSMIEIRHPSWENELNLLVEKVVKDLGCFSVVIHKLYKLLLYEKGGHFKKHRDTEKENGMFGTLIIQLPSIYTGGEFTITHGNHTVTYDFGQASGKSPYMVHYAAHYADIEHEISEVTSGYRLALVYSLCWANGNKTNLLPYKKVLDITEKMACILSNVTDTENKVFSLYLNHQYTPSALRKNGLKALKGLDADRANVIKNASNLLPIDKKYNFYIAHSNLVINYYATGGYYPRKSWYDDDGLDYNGDWEESDRNESIEEWYTETGEPFLVDSDLPVNFLSNVINANLNDEKPWLKHKEEEVEGYSGNAGPEKTTTYHKYFLVFFPASMEFELLIKSNSLCGLDSIYFLILKEENKIDNETKKKFQVFLNEILKSPKMMSISHYDTYFHHEHFYKTLVILEKFNDIELAKYCLNGVIPEFKGRSLINDSTIQKLADILSMFNWEPLQVGMISLLSPVLGKLEYTCKLLKQLVKLGKIDIAQKCLTYCLEPLFLTEFDLNDNRQSNYYNPSSSQALNVSSIHALIESFMLLNREDLMERLKIIILAKSTPQILKIIIDNLTKDQSGQFKCSSSILALYETRNLWLQKQLQQAPAFSLSMKNAAFPRHPEVEAFLKGPKSEMIYRGFNGISHARNFANAYSGCKDGYSMSICPNGTGKNAHVQIVKTKAYYENEVKLYNEYKKELPLIQSEIKKFSIK